jgi:hypothetical protein
MKNAKQQQQQTKKGSAAAKAETPKRAPRAEKPLEVPVSLVGLANKPRRRREHPLDVRAEAILLGNREVLHALACNQARHTRVREERTWGLWMSIAAGGYIVTPTSAGAFVIEDNRGAMIGVLRVMP